MSNRLGGKQGTAYVGTNAIQPPDYTFSNRDPNQYDVNNVSLGDLWLNESDESLWVLVSLRGIPGSKGSLATWSKLEAGGLSALNELTGNTGGAVAADGSGNINVISGMSGLTFTGNPATHTLTLSSTIGGDVVQTLTGNTGGAVTATLGNINVVGDDIGITIVGNPGTNTLVASLIGGGDAASTFPTDAGTANAAGSVLNIITNNATLNAGSSVLFTGVGNTIQLDVTDANSNTIIGNISGNLTLTGTNNTVLGTGSATSLTTGAGNNIVGVAAGSGITTGQANIIVGFQAGSSYVSSESSNILFNASGTAAESHALHIGSGTGTAFGELNKSFISGIVGITPVTADGIPVFIGSAGQLGTVGSGGSVFVSTVTGNSGGAVSPTAGNINIIGDGVTASVAGNPGTHTLTITALGGGGGGTVTGLVGDDAVTVFPAVGLINVISNVATLNAGSSVEFTGSGNTLQLNVTDGDNNTIIGSGAGNATISGTNNTALGYESARALTTGSTNLILGTGTAVAMTTGTDNTVVGTGAGAALTTGVNNTIIGTSAGSAYISSENNNIIIGAAVTGTVAESHVLRIGAATGAGAGEINKAFISGIVGITPATADGIPVFIGSAGQLGTVGTGGSTFISTLTGTSGGAVSPSAGNISILGGVGVTIVGNPGAHTLTISTTGGAGGITSITGDTGGAQSGPAITFAGGTTGLSFGGAANTLTTTFAGITANGGTVSLATDAITSTVNIGTGAGAKTVALGSTNTTSSLALRAGSGGITMNDGTGTISISNDAAATTVNVGNGAGAKIVTVGSTNTTSALTLNSGSGFITATGVFGVTSAESVPLFINAAGKLGTAGGSSGFINTLTANTGGPVSATGGNINIVGDGTTIEIVGNPGTHTLTVSTIGGGGGVAAFMAYLSPVQINNITGNATRYIFVYDTLAYNVGSAFNLGTSRFTAPVTGVYTFNVSAFIINVLASNTNGSMNLTFSNAYGASYIALNNIATITTSNANCILAGSITVNMTAGDTVFPNVTIAGNATANIGLSGTAQLATYFSGQFVTPL